MSQKIDINKVQKSLHAQKFGKTIVFLRKIESTNALAKQLAGYGAVEGTVVVAETQTAGHGRLNREWFSPKGGLWFSVILRPELRVAESVKLVFVACLAVAKVLQEIYGLKAETKWPNDVLMNGKKLCGILAEMNTTAGRVNFVVIGVGINADFDAGKTLPKSLSAEATSLEDELGEKIELNTLLRALLERMENLYNQFTSEGFALILKEWKEYANFLGHSVEVTSQGDKLSGLALDVSDKGSLLLRLGDQTVKDISVGDMNLRTSQK